MTTKPRRQCAKCPWKIRSNPHDIPGDYSVLKHANLIRTIATPGKFDPSSPLRIMACHESNVGRELPCVGWLDHQLNEGSNIALRLAVRNGRINAEYKLDGPQHETFDDTLPKCDYCKRPHLVSKRAREENPFCAACLHERMKKATAGKKARIVEDGVYFKVSFEESSESPETSDIAHPKPRKGKRKR